MIPDFVGEDDFHCGRLVKIMPFVEGGIQRRNRLKISNATSRTEGIFWPLTEESTEDFVDLLFRRSSSQSRRSLDHHEYVSSCVGAEISLGLLRVHFHSQKERNMLI
jgi:hypothetical protein